MAARLQVLPGERGLGSAQRVQLRAHGPVSNDSLRLVMTRSNADDPVSAAAGNTSEFARVDCPARPPGSVDADPGGRAPPRGRALAEQPVDPWGRLAQGRDHRLGA